MIAHHHHQQQPLVPSPSRRRIKPGTLVLDPREPLLVVHCTVEATIAGAEGRTHLEERAQERAVQVPRMPRDYDDCVAMAEELVVSDYANK